MKRGLNLSQQSSKVTRPVLTCSRGAFRPACSSKQTAPGAAERNCQQDAAVLGRRAALLQVSGTALLVSLSSWLPGALPAAAAEQPRQLDGAAKAAVDKALDKFVPKGKAPVMLRLAYHDAGAFSTSDRSGGANASIQFELDRPENFGLKRGWNVIEQIHGALKGTPAEGQVSKADLIALAGAKAVSVCGGPSIKLPVGRVDATAADPAGRMVSERAGVQALKANFADKGFSAQELVVLSGAHTLGGKGFGDPVTFDNAYFTALLQKPWLNPKDPMADMIGLPSDHVLPDDPECLKCIEAYAADQQLFFKDFAAAYQRLTSLGAPWA